MRRPIIAGNWKMHNNKDASIELMQGLKAELKDLSLDIYEGEFLTLLGPSGCGKTTILRMISGLEHVTSGKVYIDDVDVTDVDPIKREVNTIFQNFALFPHMTVYQNIAFGLKQDKLKKTEIDDIVKEVINLVQLNGYYDRYPHQLSGGRQNHHLPIAQFDETR